MSRMGSEAQRRMHFPELRISPQGQGIGTRLRPAWGSPRGWDFWVVRAFLLACTGTVSYTLGPFGLRSLQAGGVGILIGLVAKVGMPILAGYKLKVAARLNSRALRADAIEAITCGYLSIVLMIGLAATRILGWWWLDSVAALALIPFLIKEARAAIEGEDACCSADH